MKVDILAEVKSRIAQGYKGELIYNYGTGTYEITTLKLKADDTDVKVHKIARGVYTSAELIRAVYGKQ
jgi:hypothetical protein